MLFEPTEDRRTVYRYFIFTFYFFLKLKWWIVSVRLYWTILISKIAGRGLLEKNANRFVHMRGLVCFALEDVAAIDMKLVIYIMVAKVIFFSLKYFKIVSNIKSISMKTNIKQILRFSKFMCTLENIQIQCNYILNKTVNKD